MNRGVNSTVILKGTLVSLAIGVILFVFPVSTAGQTTPHPTAVFYLPLVFRQFSIPSPTPTPTLEPTSTLTPTPTQIPTLPYGLVLISEVMADPSGDEPAGEWIELYNPSSVAVNLSNYKVGDEETRGQSEGMLQFPPGANLAPGKAIVVANSAATFFATYGFYPQYEMVETLASVPNMNKYKAWANGNISLVNTGDEVLVLDGSNQVMDKLSWGNSTWAFIPSIKSPPAGHTLERYPVYPDTDTASDWRDQPIPAPGTVDTSQPTPPPTSTPTASTTPTNSATPTVTPTSSVTLSPTHTQTVTPTGTSTPTHTRTGESPTRPSNTHTPTPTRTGESPTRPTNTHTLTPTRTGESPTRPPNATPTGTDEPTATRSPTITPTPTATTEPAATPTPFDGRLLISEVGYNPSGSEPDAEWIEIYNPDSNTTNLEGFKLGDEETQGNAEGMLLFPPGATIAPGQIILVANLASTFSLTYGFNPDFEMRESDPNVPNLTKYSSWSSGSVSLSNLGDEVLLLDAADSLVDTVSWGSSPWAFDPPAPAVGDGHSIERYPSNQDTNSAADWRDQPTPSPAMVDLTPPTPTPTPIPTPTVTSTRTGTRPPNTHTPTGTQTATSTGTPTPTHTDESPTSPPDTHTPTNTVEPTVTDTPTSTLTPTHTNIPTATSTTTLTTIEVPTHTPTPTHTNEPTVTVTLTATLPDTPTPTNIPTMTSTSTPTATVIPTYTPTPTRTGESPTPLPDTPTPTPTDEATVTSTPTFLPTETLTTTPAAPPTPTPTGDWMLISEVLYNPAGSEPSAEWIELYNPGGTTIDLSDYILGDEETPGGTEGMLLFPPGATIAPGQIILVANLASTFSLTYGFNPDFEMRESDPNVPNLTKYSSWGSGSVSLNNLGDEVLLLDAADNLVDAVSWGSSPWAFDPPVPSVGDGHSIERYPPNQDTNSAADWVDRSTPAPGQIGMAMTNNRWTSLRAAKLFLLPTLFLITSGSTITRRILRHGRC